MEQVLTFLTRFVLALVALLAVIAYVQHRDRTRLDIALMLASLGLPVLVQMLPVDTQERRWLGTFVPMAVVAQPYLLLRLVEDFRPVHRPILLAAIAGLAGMWALLIMFGTPLPAPVTLATVAYFVTFEGYAVVAFLLGARVVRGGSRWRYGLAATGSLLLAAAILLAGVVAAVPAAEEALVLVRGFIPSVAAVSYYLAFVPPSWLRQVWQLPEVRKFLHAVVGQPARERANRLMDDLCFAATHGGGGMASAVMLWDSGREQFTAAFSDTEALRDFTFRPDDGPLTRVLKERRSIAIRDVDQTEFASARLALLVGATALLAVPVATLERAWGVLVVLQLRGSLFPADDLSLLEVLSEQCAIALDNAALVAEQQQRADQERVLSARLETANRELEAFAYSVSHDLRAPLRAIDGFSLALVKDYQDKLDEQGMRYLSRVRGASQRMGRLIDDLLRLSRMTRSELDVQEVDLSALAADIAESLRRQDIGRSVRFIIASGATARGDPGLLRIALENLLGNAWKFTSKQPSATIEFGVDGDAEKHTYFVRDDGVGFDMEYVGKLFGPFQRLHADEGFDGTGIGLATVERIVARHGGRVWAKGAVEQGATFYFTLNGKR